MAGTIQIVLTGAVVMAITVVPFAWGLYRQIQQQREQEEEQEE